LSSLDDIKDLMNPHKISQDWYYQSFYQKCWIPSKYGTMENWCRKRFDSLQDLYSTARELSTEQLTLLLEVAIVLLILWK